jgi:hypothetical protein
MIIEVDIGVLYIRHCIKNDCVDGEVLVSVSGSVSELLMSVA